MKNGFDQIASIQRIAEEFERRCAAADRGPVRVLIVDDDYEFRSLVCRLPRRFNIEVVEAGSYDEAIAKAPPGSMFDLAIIDVRLKGDNDGVDLVKYLRSHAVILPICLISGYLDAETALRAQEIGGFVPSAPKPKHITDAYIFQMFATFNLHRRMGIAQDWTTISNDPTV